MLENEFVVASPQQQQAIASFTASSSQRHLVLTGAAGTGKTLVALQVANKLIQALEATASTELNARLRLSQQETFSCCFCSAPDER